MAGGTCRGSRTSVWRRSTRVHQRTFGTGARNRGGAPTQRAFQTPCEPNAKPRLAARQVQGSWADHSGFPSLQARRLHRRPSIQLSPTVLGGRVAAVARPVGAAGTPGVGDVSSVCAPWPALPACHCRHPATGDFNPNGHEIRWTHDNPRVPVPRALRTPKMPL